MDGNNNEQLPEDLRRIADRLRTERPALTTFELDRIKLDARTRAVRAERRSARKGSFMRSRLAIAMILVLGLVMSGTGAALSISGTSGSGSSGDAQYPTTPTQTVQPTTETGNTNNTDNTTPPVQAQEVQSNEQVSTGSELPFTGFAAIPVLLGGLALLGTGLVLRRGSRSDSES